MKHRLPTALLLASTLFLAACESSEERAEKHFEAGNSYYQEGDLKRAALEMRNALQLAPDHKEARLALAEIQLENGDLQRAVRQYRSLLERYPDLGEAHLALAGIAIDLGDWQTVERHTEAATGLLEPSPELTALQASVAYRTALAENETEVWQEQISIARDLVEADPELLNARRIVIDGLLREEKLGDALEFVDGGMALAPDRYEYYQLRLGILQQLGLSADITNQLQEMVERFPEEDAVPVTLVRWHIEQGDLDSAEAFLRDRAAADPENLDRQTELAQFLRAQRGFDAVNAELTRLSEAGGTNAGTFRAMRAALMFENGQASEAITELQSLLEAQPEEDAHGTFANDVRVDLARMQTATGDADSSRSLVDTVLEHDPTHTAALKMRAAWMIDGDEIEEAIVTLRSALSESPRDAQIMTLMAAAHDRAGETELKREMLALAVEASRSAPAESLRYAQELVSSDNLLSAEDVLLDALRLHRSNVELYVALGNVYVALEDWSRAEQVLGVLEQIADQTEDPRSRAGFNALQARLLARQERDEEFIGFLESLGDDANSRLAAEVAIIRALFARGEAEEGEARLAAALENNPDAPALRFLDSSLKAANSEFAEAEAGYRELLAENPQADELWMALYRLYLVQDDRDGASAVLTEALDASPDSPVLLFTRAGELETIGDPEGAIAIYETLYARNSSAESVANNLSSMLSTYRDTPEDLDRAYRVGRRLQDSQVPAYRDTYGWIAARKGQFEEAERHLRFAIAGFPDHPVVQFHYAVTLAGLNRETEALEHFQRALELNATSGLLPQVDQATTEAEIDRLTASLEGTAEDQPEASPTAEN